MCIYFMRELSVYHVFVVAELKELITLLELHNSVFLTEDATFSFK
jgi:hypothetical protein